MTPKKKVRAMPANDFTAETVSFKEAFDRLIEARRAAQTALSLARTDAEIDSARQVGIAIKEEIDALIVHELEENDKHYQPLTEDIKRQFSKIEDLYKRIH